MTLPFDLGLGAAVYMAVAVLISAFVRGYSGFGFSALVIASSALVTNPLNFVAVVVVCEMAMTAQAWKGLSKYVDWRRVWLLMAGAAVGMPLGLWALTSISEDSARAAISAYILLMCMILYAGWKMKAEARPWAHLGAGLVSGLANAPGMGGLPVAAFFAAQPIAAVVFRATLVAYFPILDIYAVPLYYASGLISWNSLWATLMVLPMVFIGNWLGGRHFFRTDPKDFRKFAIGLLALLAVMGLGKAVL
jgi:uncharacterized membrane protein YfcA